MKALYDYSNGKEPSPCLMLTTGSPRKALKSFEDFTCDNQVTAFIFNVEFEESLANCIRNVEEKMDDMKTPGLTDELY